MALEARFDRTARRPVSGGQSAREEYATTRAKPMVLCVDDESDAQTILRLFLSAHGFQIITASSAPEALELVTEQHPDLIITDYAMPGMTGLELCRALRERAATRDIPIILHSGIELYEDHSDLFDHFILKPTELDHLARVIRSLLPQRRAQRFG